MVRIFPDAACNQSSPYQGYHTCDKLIPDTELSESALGCLLHKQVIMITSLALSSNITSATLQPNQPGQGKPYLEIKTKLTGLITMRSQPLHLSLY